MLRARVTALVCSYPHIMYLCVNVKLVKLVTEALKVEDSVHSREGFRAIALYPNSSRRFAGCMHHMAYTRCVCCVVVYMCGKLR